jgi:para-aminobenzoate synthetase component 1
MTAPWREPADVLAAFADEPWAVGLLGGGEGPEGRWSYLARQPKATLVLEPNDPREALAALRALASAPTAFEGEGPPFRGGVIGLASYELGERLDPIGLRRKAGWPDLVCARYPAVLAFDHMAGRVFGAGGDADAARSALSWLSAAPPRTATGALAAPPTADAVEAYESAVADVVARIAAGEIFQANIARRWLGRLAPGARPFDLAARLAAASPAPFAAYLNLGSWALVSNSPERFVSATPCRGQLLARTQPIKGTRPRGRSADEDAALAAALVASAKDRAENLMIVDLMRNDFSRVCAAGEVHTPELFKLATFANVHHLVSTVTGALAEGRDAIDLLGACFPPGSITGAPKLQAMKVIADAEPPRGPFFGSVFWLGGDGALDSSVLIRSVLFEREAAGWRFEARAGAGIIADSDPVAERLETETKIAAILGALAAKT